MDPVDSIADRVTRTSREFFAEAEKMRAVTAVLERAAATELVRRNDETLGRQKERRTDPPRPYTGPDRRRL